MLQRRASPAEHDEEAEANAVAESIAPGGSPKANANALAGAANEPALPGAERARLASTLGPGVEAVRVRRDAGAHAEAAARGALGVTRGNDVSLGRRAPSPTSLAGRWLMAHEMTHALQQQQDGDGPRVRLQQPPPPPPPPPTTGTQAGAPGDLANPTTGLDVDQVVNVSAPL